MGHVYREKAENNREVTAWQVQDLAEHFKTPRTPAPAELQHFIRNKQLIIARDHHENILISIDVPGAAGTLLQSDWLVIYGKRLYVVPGEIFKDDYDKIVPVLPEKLPDNSREELEVQRCSRPNCKQKASFMFEDDVRQLPVFRCPQHLAGDICWDALSTTEVKSLQKLGE